MERIRIEAIRSSNTPFIKNATTLVTEFEPFLPYFNFKNAFINYINDNDLLNEQHTSEEGYENPFNTIRSMLTKYGNLINAYKINAKFQLELERKTGDALNYVEGYTPSEEEKQIEDSEECPECKILREAIESGKKAIGNINIANTAFDQASSLLADDRIKVEVSVYIDNYNFNVLLANKDHLTDNLYKITKLTVTEFHADLNAVQTYLNNMIEYMKETIEDGITAKYTHYLLEYTASAVGEEIDLLCYRVSAAELASKLEGELRIAPIHRTETDILWIPIRYTKQPFLNAVRGKGRTTDISENYVDTVIGNIRIKKEDRVNNLEYVEHHNEVKWLEKVGFSKDKKEILLYIK